MRQPSYAPLDDALEAIAGYGIVLENGNSNHAPMVAEALCALGRPEAVMPWITRYRARMTPRGPVGEPIRRDGWRGALGRRERFAAWALLFAEELEEARWEAVLDRWTNRLMPGFCAAATHGPIRVGHAVRALADSETSARLRELADALAGWAATYWELPISGVPGNGSINGSMSPRRAIAEIPLVPPGQRRAGNIVAGLAALADLPEFAAAAGLLDTNGAVAPLLAELTDTFARVFTANARAIPTAIAFVHCVTSLAALGNLVPHLGDATSRTALRHAWQTACGLYACYAGSNVMVETGEPPAAGGEELADRAIANGDEHVIKFTEACLNRNAVSPSPAYPGAVAHLLGIMPRR